MKYYQFKAPMGDTRMISTDRAASKIPDHSTGSPWLLEKELDKPSDEIVAAVAKNGYYKCP
jgi:hypothetical protein